LGITSCKTNQENRVEIIVGVLQTTFKDDCPWDINSRGSLNNKAEENKIKEY
jgi:hypothetical protein